MGINFLQIKYFKSLVNVSIEDPGNFMVFFGSNASGKSNIFEAIEFANLVSKMKGDAIKFYDNPNEIRHRNYLQKQFYFKFGSYTENCEIQSTKQNVFSIANNIVTKPLKYYFANFSRIFIGKTELVKLPYKDDGKLTLDCDNLETVLKRLLKNTIIKEELLELLSLLIPGFKDINIEYDTVSGQDKLMVYENNIKDPFNERLISDGTFNIICLLVVALQSDEPQFVCIEEPENGLNPKSIKVLVNYLRDKCIQNQHIIWLNTHSQTLVSELNVNEVVVVDKINGVTKVKQFDSLNLHGLKVDEAWLSNVFDGGLPW